MRVRDVGDKLAASRRVIQMSRRRDARATARRRDGATARRRDGASARRRGYPSKLPAPGLVARAARDIHGRLWVSTPLS